MTETLRGAQPSRHDPPAPGRSRGATAALVVACAAVLLVLVDYNAPLVTVPDTAAALGTGPTGQTWLISAISLGLAAVILIVGSLADDYGRRRVFVLGTVLFAVATAAGALATGTLVFVLARVVQGGAGAAMLAAGMGLVAHAYPSGAARVRATSTWGAMLGLGIAIGPLLSAGLAHAVSWRACYWLYAAGAAVLAVFAARLVEESRATTRRRLDLPGVLTLGIGLACLLAAITEGRAGWLRPVVGILLAAALVALIAFLVIEARRTDPMLDLGLFRHPGFIVATSGALFTGLGIIGVLSYMPTVYQQTMGLSPLDTAWLITVWAGVSFIVSLQSRHLTVRMSNRWQMIIGLLLSGAGYLPMLGAVAAGSWQRLAIGFFIAGIGSGLLNAALARLAVESVPADRSGMGSGANNTARYIGSSLGVALTVVIVSAVSPDGGTASGLGHGTDLALGAAVGLTVLGAVIALVARERPAR